MLAALGAAHDDDASRNVLHAHGRLDLVHVLAALTAGAHGRSFEVAVFDLDVDLVLDVRGDFDRSETGLPARVAVERTDAHQAVHAHLGAQIAVRVRTVHGERSAVDALFITGLKVDHFGLETAALAPTEIHAQHHLAPVFGVCATGAWVNADNRVRVVHWAREHALQLDFADALFEGRHLGLYLVHDLFVVVGSAQLEQLDGVRDVLRERFDPDQLFGR